MLKGAYTPRFIALFAAPALTLLGGSPQGMAAWQDEIGYARLKARLGSLTPVGQGISVTQIESAQGTNYLPEFGTTNPIQGTGGLLGKLITDASQLGSDSAPSDHARAVAGFCYSNNPNVALATGITEITVFEAEHWLADGFIQPDDGQPGVERSPIQNHSWIGSGTNAVLRRFDYAIERDRFTALVGLNNDPETPVPDLLASSYNAISVGRSDGLHSTGGTPSDLDGPGRTKPEIVVPQSATSWSTATASSAVALLLETAKASPQLADASRPETIKAILMAGTSKDRFPSWTRTPGRPVDATFGAGQLDIDASHRILESGKSPPGSRDIPPSGWSFTTVTSNSPAEFSFTVSEGYRIAELTVSSAWNRTMLDSDPGPGFRPSPVLPDASLTLLFTPTSSATPTTIDQSTSPVDNFEHMFVRNRPSGTYSIRATTDRSTNLAIAWNYRIERDVPLTITSIFRIGATGEVAIVWPASPGRFYSVERSSNLAAWTTVPGSGSLPARPPAMVFIDTSPVPGTSYYRIVESTSQSSP